VIFVAQPIHRLKEVFATEYVQLLLLRQCRQWRGDRFQEIHIIHAVLVAHRIEKCHARRHVATAPHEQCATPIAATYLLSLLRSLRKRC